MPPPEIVDFLCDDVLRVCLSFLPGPALASIACTCRVLAGLADDSRTWAKVVLAEFGVALSELKPAARGGGAAMEAKPARGARAAPAGAPHGRAVYEALARSRAGAFAGDGGGAHDARGSGVSRAAGVAAGGGPRGAAAFGPRLVLVGARA